MVQCQIINLDGGALTDDNCTCLLSRKINRVILVADKLVFTVFTLSGVSGTSLLYFIYLRQQAFFTWDIAIMWVYIDCCQAPFSWRVRLSDWWLVRGLKNIQSFKQTISVSQFCSNISQMPLEVQGQTKLHILLLRSRSQQRQYLECSDLTHGNEPFCMKIKMEMRVWRRTVIWIVHRDMDKVIIEEYRISESLYVC